MAITRQKPLTRGEVGDKALIINNIGELYRIARVLSSHVRVQILYYLALYGELSVKQLAELTKTPLPIVSRHVKKLEQEGLVITGLKTGRRGLRKILKKRYDRIIVRL